MTGKSVSCAAMAEKVSKRALRRRHNHTALLEAALQQIGARGPEAVTVDDIVHAAGVAKGTFYNHFDDKQAVVRAVARQVRIDAQRAVRAAISASSDPAERVAGALAVFMGMPAADPARAAILTRVFAGMFSPNAAINQPLRETLELGFAQGRFAGMSLAAAVTFVLATARAGMAVQLERGDAREGRALAIDLVVACLRGLGVDSGQASALAAAAHATSA
jgi:AcrR family transcriptional regulator